MTRNEKSGAAALPVPPRSPELRQTCCSEKPDPATAPERRRSFAWPESEWGGKATRNGKTDTRRTKTSGTTSKRATATYCACITVRSFTAQSFSTKNPHTGRSRAGGSTTGLMRSYTGSPYTKRSSERDWPDCSCSRPSGCVSTDTYSTYGRIPIPPTDLCAACWSARAMFSAERYGTENLPVVHTKKSSAKARKKAAERTFPPLLRNGQSRRYRAQESPCL